MDINSLFKEVESFEKYLQRKNNSGFVISKYFNRELQISNPENADLRQLGLGSASGLYFLVGSDDKVLYIGKATKGNLHAELWGKLRTPVGDQIPMQYPNTYWSKMPDLECANDLLNGKISIAVLKIDPPEYSSLFEVYLQTHCYFSGKFPKLNSQIG